MRANVLPFTAKQADTVSEYCCHVSENLPPHIRELWEWTLATFEDREKMSSPSQGQWMVWMAQWVSPKRILDVGTYSGFSASAWYEGTKHTKAEIVTLELDEKMASVATEIFRKNHTEDRIKVVQGPAKEGLKAQDGKFDLIFMDVDKVNYELYIDIILEKKLLSPHGIILCNNVFARGLTIGKDFGDSRIAPNMRGFWEENGAALRKFNEAMCKDPRVDVVVLPLFDGVTQIKWNRDYLKLCGEAIGHGNSSGCPYM